jgi:hypothetical protein
MHKWVDGRSVTLSGRTAAIVGRVVAALRRTLAAAGVAMRVSSCSKAGTIELLAPGLVLPLLAGAGILAGLACAFGCRHKELPFC